jgi:H+-transporting ATPase
MIEPTIPQGLTDAEAVQKLAQSGPNSVADVAVHPIMRALGEFSAPVPWLLEATVVLELCLGKLVEAVIIGGLLLFNAALGFYQEGRAQATLAALKSRLSLTASVRRGGIWKTVAAATLVPGDLVKLSLGGVVPADVRLCDGDVLLDQSMLTGESIPIDAGAGLQTYAGTLVRRGEATAEVTATGSRTKFGRTAELIRTAHVVSSQQGAVFRVVRNLALCNGVIIVAMLLYARARGLAVVEMIPLGLTALLASIPVALPATFTLAAALGARALAKRGILPTRLSAVDEAASMDVLCADKTGTLTRNALSVAGVSPVPGIDDAQLLEYASLASSEAGADPVDAAIRARAAEHPPLHPLRRTAFLPFDPANKRSEATCVDADGTSQRVIKGAVAAVAGLAPLTAATQGAADALAAQGVRVLAVAAGPPDAPRLLGLIALSDPPRDDSRPLIAQLHSLGVQTVMITGDAAATAAVVARSVGLDGPVCPPGAIPARVEPGSFAVFAGVLPEGKFQIVKAFQSGGHTVGMCGDGANDAPALRQAQIGIAVSTATDVAKSAAGMVLTGAGLGGIVDTVKEGRLIFQRILTYTLNSMTKKITQVLLLAVGLLMTGHAVLTPLLMVIVMITGDFLGMSLTTDNVRPSPRPNAWNIRALTVASVVMGVGELCFCSTVLALGSQVWHWDLNTLRTLTFVAIVAGNQATTYNNRERRHLWASAPAKWVLGSSAADLAVAATLAIAGIGMSPLPPSVVLGVVAAAAVFAIALDFVKVPMLRHLKIT